MIRYDARPARRVLHLRSAKDKETLGRQASDETQVHEQTPETVTTFGATTASASQQSWWYQQSGDRSGLRDRTRCDAPKYHIGRRNRSFVSVLQPQFCVTFAAIKDSIHLWPCFCEWQGRATGWQVREELAEMGSIVRDTNQSK